MKDDGSDDVNKIVGNRIKELREYQGMSQSDLGSACEKSGKYISSKEKGKEAIQVNKLKEISDGLKIKELKDFFDFGTIPPYLVKAKKKRKIKNKQ